MRTSKRLAFLAFAAALAAAAGSMPAHGQAQLADVFVDSYAELDRMQERLWDSFDMLDARNRAVLAAYARQRAEGMQIHPTDAATIHRDVERSGETLAQYFGRMCPEG